jgi:predicted RNase H-like HicB family nuclease
MVYAYEAKFAYSEDDCFWYVDFPAFQGDCFTDGATIEDAVRNAADVLTLHLSRNLTVVVSRHMRDPLVQNLPLNNSQIR